MHEAVFRVEPAGPYGAPTAGTDAVVELWCNDHCDLLAVGGDPDGEVLAAVESEVGVRERLVEAGGAVVVTDDCLKGTRDTVEGHLAAHSCLLVPPLRYADGAKFCRVLALDPADLSAVYRELGAAGAVDVESKHSVGTPAAERPLLTVESVLPSLSARQREVLLLAHERGYYELPRETSTADLADAVGVQRRTLEEHLRRAERKLVEALVGYLGPGPGPSGP